jgi:flagellar FliJ protein
MKKSERLKVIIDLHTRQEQDALQALGRNQKKLQDLQAQLEHLQKYRQDYSASFAEQQRAGMNVNQLLELRAFADKLDKAIDGQQLAVSAQDRELLRARTHWEECHQRTKSLQKVSDLALADELKAESKREQVEQDERAARSGRKDGTGNAL